MRDERESQAEASFAQERGGSDKVAVVVSHGSLARGLVSAMEKVLGPQPNVFWVENTGKSTAALGAEIQALLEREAGDRDVYLLTDLRGGSCATGCLLASRTAGVGGVFYGVNLTLLLEFVLLQHLAREEFFGRVLGKAQGSISGSLFSRVPEDGGGAGPQGATAPGAPVASVTGAQRRP